MDDEFIIFPINIKPSYADFLNALFIKKNGLAAQLFKPIYNQIFIHSIDIKKEYFKYYSVEYPTLCEYVEIYYSEKLSEEKLDKKYIFRFKNSIHLTDLAYGTDYYNHIIGILKKMEEKNEN